MERLHCEICALRQVVKLQADVGEELRVVTSTIDRRVAVVERHVMSDGREQLGTDMPGVRIHGLDAQAGAADVAGEIPGVLDVLAGSQASTGSELSNGDVIRDGHAGGVDTDIVNKNIEGVADLPNSPKWSTVVKQGWRKKDKSHPVRIKQSINKSERKRLEPIHGTGVQGNIKAVRTKLVNVFATKFLPDLDAETLCNYLKERLGRHVQCERIVTGNTRCSSFKVSVECEDVTEVYNSELWPEGSLVRRYYEPRKATRKGTAELC
uniref:uncharacterized protein LOC109967043 isoform X1 n=1 Tax=Monopterus albus TaxID=43700 RepID=UPI0009B4E61C|nr:uncharacterized protein LOC109967043 isoform X1 [Monopterus albus]XP_020468025.1 uncharacterized protein LOC109967043 isoform X2 [Monopterus albus]